MTDYIHLLGAEDVRTAANTMRAAAQGMHQASTNIQYALERHQRFLDDWLVRLEAIITSKETAR